MSTRRRPAQSPHTKAFTLIELIVVVAIIAILASIALIVGGKVTQQARANTTKDLLRVLDNTQTSLLADRDTKVPWKYTDESQQRNEYAALDARMPEQGTSENDRAEPSLTFYLLATKEAPSVQSATGNFDARFVSRADIISKANASQALLNNAKDFSKIIMYQSTIEPRTSAAQPVAGLVIKDPWGNPIRFVHPKFDGGYGEVSLTGVAPALPPGREMSGTVRLNQGGSVNPVMFRRSMRPFNPTASSGIGDADEGLCQGSTGYFYSPGLDGDPGTRGDNVYLNATPTFPKETANIN